MSPRHSTKTASVDKAIGITAIIVGVLVLVGELTFEWIVPLVGAIMVVIGILMLVDVLRGSTVVGMVFILVGVLLMVNLLGLPDIVGRVIDLIVGVALIVMGVLKLT